MIGTWLSLLLCLPPAWAQDTDGATVEHHISQAAAVGSHLLEHPILFSAHLRCFFDLEALGR